jgi:segregation and condensation protein B
MSAKRGKRKSDEVLAATEVPKEPAAAPEEAEAEPLLSPGVDAQRAEEPPAASAPEAVAEPATAPETVQTDASPVESAAAEPEVDAHAEPSATKAEPDDDDDPDDVDDESSAEPAGLREKIEALLFSAPKPVRSAEIAELCVVSKEEARSALRSLKADYRKRRTGLEIVKIDGRYQMRVRRGAEEAARLVSPTDISRELLKTVTVIAYFQPALQSELVDMVGSKAYDHVRELEERKLIRSVPYAQTKVLATGSAFAEYFGLRTGKPEDVRKWVAKRLGREAPGPRHKLTPALMAAEAALDPDFVAGRSVEAPPTPEETAAPPAAPPAEGAPPSEAAPSTAPVDASAEPVPQEAETLGTEEQSPAAG